MIVKVVPGRRDGKTDIKQLAQYITQGMGDQVRLEAGFGQAARPCVELLTRQL